MNMFVATVCAFACVISAWASDDEVSLLQTDQLVRGSTRQALLSNAPRAQDAAQVDQPKKDRPKLLTERSSEQGQAGTAELHYWPHARGNIGQYSRTSYSVPSEKLKNLSASLAWTWVHPTNLSAFVWGTLIDKDKNIIIASMQGLFKYKPDGELLWKRPDIMMSQMPVLMGSALYGMQMGLAQMYALDLRTGATLWSRKEALFTGIEGDMVEAHNGVVVAAVDMVGLPAPTGAPAKRAIGVNASNGQTLWSYTPECGIWNIMALFPDEDTTIFMDYCGGLYRLGLYSGSLIWKHSGSPESNTDGGATLAPDGSIYTCSDGPNAHWGEGVDPGRVRKYRLSDGALLWETKLPNACMNFPSVSFDGETVVLADGANVLAPRMKTMLGRPQEEIDKFYALQQELLRNKTQLSYYGYSNLNASILGFDSRTGQLKWKHDVEPWYGLSFANDEERAYNMVSGKGGFGHCGPPHWGGATLDKNGNVFIARSNGELYIYNPRNDSETTFHTGDGALMAGASFAPGLMVVPTCSWVYVFRF
mmetsp:Transcript_149311/g.362639  ORF Transcript_149311/g.362639 Transcript_149311/m.362639 type:complete len:534 (-) Transcript_149311:48-1649(-)